MGIISLWSFASVVGHLVYRNGVLDGTPLTQAGVNFMMCDCVLP